MGISVADLLQVAKLQLFPILEICVGCHLKKQYMISLSTEPSISK